MNRVDRIDADPYVDAPEEQLASPPARKWPKMALMLSLPLVLVAVGIYFWLTSGRFESTDNAYYQQNMISVSAEVTGRITDVHVRENQRVAAGELLFRIDDAPYRIALAQAEANMADARIRVAQLGSALAARQADAGARAAEVRMNAETLGRQVRLLKDGFTTRANYDAAVAALDTSRQDRASAVADVTAARSALGNGDAARHPFILAAEAARDKAALDLQRTEVRAPQAGIVSQTERLQVGQLALTGMPTLSVVVPQGGWVEANFKETQIDRMHIGQLAEVRFDAFPGRRFDARVVSIGAGTGSQFSVLPAQNATGNWVKVTQRVPVRLKVLNPPDESIVAGLSAEVKVDIRR
jgi:membrane fusion protein (multidrug efflux system)